MEQRVFDSEQTHNKKQRSRLYVKTNTGHDVTMYAREVAMKDMYDGKRIAKNIPHKYKETTLYDQFEIGYKHVIMSPNKFIEIYLTD